MGTPIADLYAALQSEVDRVVHEQEAADKSDELSEVLLATIRETLGQIKLGADSDEFAELTIINFIIRASDEGYTPLEIKNFVQTLRPSPAMETITII